MSSHNYGQGGLRPAAGGGRRTTERTDEDFDQMFAEADSRSAMEGRRAAHRGTFGTESGLGGAKASSITTGKDARREEEREKLLALQKHQEDDQNVHAQKYEVEMAQAPAYADFEAEARGSETISKSRIGMRPSATSRPMLMLTSLELDKMEKSEFAKRPTRDETKGSLSLPQTQSAPSQKNSSLVNAGSLNNEQSLQLQEYQERAYKAAADGLATGGRHSSLSSP